MKRIICSSGLLVILSVPVMAQSPQKGLDNHFDVEAVAVVDRPTPLPDLYICAALPTGFESTDGHHQFGNNRALTLQPPGGTQGDEGLFTARGTFFSFNPDCSGQRLPMGDVDPLPNE